MQRAPPNQQRGSNFKTGLGHSVNPVDSRGIGFRRPPRSRRASHRHICERRGEASVGIRNVPVLAGSNRARRRWRDIAVLLREAPGQVRKCWLIYSLEVLIYLGGGSSFSCVKSALSEWDSTVACVLVSIGQGAHCCLHLHLQPGGSPTAPMPGHRD